MKYRSEIDGLRAVAVVPVILFHAGFEVFSGGYVGVDIFFVISGYLITLILLDEIERGDFSVLRFYERRARRILPALFFVMASCIPLAWAWMTPSQMEEFGKGIVSVVFFVSNFVFWRESGYFAAPAETNPLLHTWSLAVEEQYYIFAPLCLLLFWRHARRFLFPAVVATAVASLLLAEWGWRNNPSAAFFLTPYRVWELLAGAICAFLVRRQPCKANDWLAAAGLALILFAILAYDSATPFPSFYTLVPVVGAALILLFAQQGTFVARLLSARLFVGIGLVSYSAYLWHQPLFAFARIRTMGEAPAWLFMLLAGLSLLLAYVSWRFIEQPFRRGRARWLPTRRAVFGTSTAAAAVLVAFGAYGYRSDGVPWRAAGQAEPGSWEANMLASLTMARPGGACGETHQLGSGQKARMCEIFAPPNPRHRIMVLGDSHAAASLPALAAIGEENAVYEIGMGGCPGLLDVSVVAGNFPLGVCENLARFEYDVVKNGDFDLVILIGRWSLYTFGTQDRQKNYYLVREGDRSYPTAAASRAVFAEALADTVRRYRDLGVGVVVVDQVPQQVTTPREWVERAVFTGVPPDLFVKAVERTSIRVEDDRKVQSFARAALDGLQGDGIWVWSFDDAFAEGERYLWADANGSFYADFNHLTEYGARRLSGGFAARFKEIAPSLAGRCEAEVASAGTGDIGIDVSRGRPCRSGD